MGENSKIEWTDHTFNGWLGCAKVSEACRNCYAEGWAKRWGNADLWRGRRQRTSEANWKKPLKWNEQAKAAGVRAKVFCASLADVFELYGPRKPTLTASDVEMRATMEEWRADLWQLIRDTPHLDWLLLTKRPENIANMLPPDWGTGYENVWLGTTVENQRRADERLPHILKVPAVIRFVSVEPMGGPIDIEQFKQCTECSSFVRDYGSTPSSGDGEECGNCGNQSWRLRIHWVIAGGESGPNASPSHPDWFRSLRDQCEETGVAYMFKQWGEYGPVPTPTKDGFVAYHDGDDEMVFGGLNTSRPHTFMEHVGKKAAGRVLDGRTWDGFPPEVCLSPRNV